jgi:5-methylcytosine-specific restriction endonuclease McrA
MKRLWQSNRYIYIPFFKYKWYYKQAFLKWAKKHNLKYYRKWKLERNRKKHKYRTNNPEAKRAKIRQRGICGICKKPFLRGQKRTLDHIVPKSILKDKKLYDNPRNHQLAHEWCNGKKGNTI